MKENIDTKTLYRRKTYYYIFGPYSARIEIIICKKKINIER